MLIDRSGSNPINYKKITTMAAKKKAKKVVKKVAKKTAKKKARA